MARGSPYACVNCHASYLSFWYSPCRDIWLEMEQVVS